MNTKSAFIFKLVFSKGYFCYIKKKKKMRELKIASNKADPVNLK